MLDEKIELSPYAPDKNPGMSSICNKDIPNKLDRQTQDLCVVCYKLPVSEYEHKYCFMCCSHGSDEFKYHYTSDGICEIPEPTKLRGEMSMTFVYPGDKVCIEVPLRFRKKYDEVMRSVRNNWIRLKYNKVMLELSNYFV